MSAQRILAFDTALGACSVAVAQCGQDGSCRVLARAFEVRNRGHAEVLMPMIEQVLQDAGCAYTDLARIGVTVGPGTFTGVRLGIAAARGLALATGLDVVTMTTLEALALNVPGSEIDGSDARIIATHDARRGDLYVQTFEARRSPLDAPQVMPVTQAAHLVQEAGAIVVGTGATLLRDAVGESAANGPEGGHGQITVSAGLPQPDAAVFAVVLADREPCVDAPEPLYLRAPDAKLPARMGVERRP